VNQSAGPSGTVKAVAMGIALVCMLALIITAWAASQYRRATVRGPLLVEPVSVAVAPDGTIFCATYTGRIHRYGSDGKGQGAWPAEGPSVPIRIGIVDEQYVAVAFEGQSLLLLYELGGRISQTRTDADAWDRFEGSTHAWQGTGPLVAVREGAIVQQSAGVIRTLVPAPPFPLRLYQSAPWLLVIGLFMSALGVCVAFVAPFLARSQEAAVS
jgi:hypothetical protein